MSHARPAGGGVAPDGWEEGADSAGEPTLVGIGLTGLSIGQFSLGTGAIGGMYGHTPPDAEASALLEVALQRGVRLIDTAPVYGSGLAERRVGEALGRTSRPFTLSTKVGFRVVRHKHRDGAEHVADFSRDGILRSLEESLARLQVARVDIALVHDPDQHYQEAVGHAFPTLLELRDQGVISAVGAGMNQWEMLTRFVHEVNLDCVLVAGRYTLLDQSAASQLLPACVEADVSVIVGGVYNGGILADIDKRPMFNYVPAMTKHIRRARELEAVCLRHGVPLKAAALQFPGRHRAVVSVLSGCASVAELEENLAMADVTIPEDLWSELKDQGLVDQSAW